MNQKVIIAVLAACVLLLTACGTVVYAQTAKDPAAEASAENWGQTQEKAHDLEDMIYTDSPLSLYEKNYAKATDAQKKQLENIQTGKMSRYGHEYTKQILIIMGELPADTPRITLEQARSICKDIQEKNPSYEEFAPTVLAAFNEIAGAPDYDGGNGLRFRDYYLNDQQTEVIRVFGTNVGYINEETGASEVLCRWHSD